MTVVRRKNHQGVTGVEESRWKGGPAPEVSPETVIQEQEGISRKGELPSRTVLNLRTEFAGDGKRKTEKTGNTKVVTPKRGRRKKKGMGPSAQAVSGNITLEKEFGGGRGEGRYKGSKGSGNQGTSRLPAKGGGTKKKSFSAEGPKPGKKEGQNGKRGFA